MPTRETVRPSGGDKLSVAATTIGRARAVGAGAAALALALDQGTKAMVLNSETLVAGGVFRLGPNLDLMFVRNTGVSFGMLQAVPVWALIGVTTLIVVWFGAWLFRTQQAVIATGLGLIIGGASSNIIDRMRHGGVTDFIDLHWNTWHWPAFNTADATITVGAVLLIVGANVGLGRRERP